jgi:predicted nucleic acid-binding protein
LIYLDSSALVKLVVTERGTPALARWLARHSELPLISSIVHRTEVPRAVWRADPGALPRAYRQLRRIGQVALSAEVLEAAGTLSPESLRSLDAIHLASALRVRRDLTAFITYDKHLLNAARDAGLPTTTPT